MTAVALESAADASASARPGHADVHDVVRTGAPPVPVQNVDSSYPRRQAIDLGLGQVLLLPLDQSKWTLFHLIFSPTMLFSGRGFLRRLNLPG